jgi:hypothetical protein
MFTRSVLGKTGTVYCIGCISLLWIALTWQPAMAACMPIGFGQPIAGSIDQAGEQDEYCFSASGGDTLIVRLQLTKGVLAPEVRLCSADGTELQRWWNYGGQPLDTEASLPADGQYKILVCDHWVGSTGNYLLYIERRNKPTQVTPISFGEPVSGSMDSGVKVDFYSFSANAGDTVILRLQVTKGVLAPEVSLWSADGTELQRWWNYGGQPLDTEASLPADGQYKILVCDHWVGSTGNYLLYIERRNKPTHVTPISFGEPVSGSTDSGVKVDFYSFSANAGDTVILRLQVTKGVLAPEVSLWSADGTKLQRWWNYGGQPLDIEQSLPTSGEYKILVCDHWVGSTGSYSIYVQRFPNPGHATQVKLGEPVSGSIGSGVEADTYVFSGNGGDCLTIWLDKTSGSLTPEVKLYGPDGGLVQTRWNNDELEIQGGLPRTGQYGILVCDHYVSYTGGYTLSIAGESPMRLTAGVPHTAGISNDEWHCYQFNVDEVGRNLLVAVTPASATAALEVYGRYGQPAGRAQSDCTAKVKNGFGNYELLISPAVDGSYYFGVRGSKIEKSADYTITASLVDRHISEVYPRKVTNSAGVDMHVLGLGFEPGMRVELKSGATTVAANTTVLSSPQMMIAQFDLSTVPLGEYDTSILWPDGSRMEIDKAIEIRQLPAGAIYAFDLDLIEGQAWSSSITVPNGLDSLFVTLQKSTLVGYGYSWSSTLTLKQGTQQVAKDNGSNDLIIQVPNPAAGAYTIDVTTNNAGRGILTVWDKLPELPMGQWMVGKVHCSYGSAWYQVDVTPGQEKLRLEGEGIGAWSHFDIYRNQYEGSEHWVSPDGPQTSIEIPNPQAGTYIVQFLDSAMLYPSSGSSDWLEDQSRDVMIKANTTTTFEPSPVYLPAITSLSTDKGGNAGLVTVTIKGGWLDPNATVSLVREGHSGIAAQSVLGDPNRTSLMATFDLAGQDPGQYTLAVTNPDGHEIAAPAPFTIEPGGEPKLWVEIVGRDTIRAGRENTYILRYGNSGQVDASHVWLFVAVPSAVNYEIDLPWQMSVPPDDNVSSMSDQGNPMRGTLMEILSLPAGASSEISMRLVAPDVADSLLLVANITLDASEYFESLILGIPDDPLEFLGGSVQTPRLSASRISASGISSTPPAGYILFWDDYPGDFCNHVAKSIGGGQYIEMTSEGIHVGTLEGDYVTPSQGPGKKGGYLGDVKPPWWSEDDASNVEEAAAQIEELLNEGRLDAEYTQKICQNRFVPPTETTPGIINTNCVGLTWFLNPQFKLSAKGAFSPEAMYDELKGSDSWKKDAWTDSDASDAPSQVENGELIEKEGQIYHEGEDGYHKLRDAARKLLRAVASATPEDKYGPAGVAAPGIPPEEQKRFVSPGSGLYYKVDFWNKEDATAPACDVLVRDPLDPNVDARSFRFEEVGFRKWAVKLEPCQYFNVNMDMRPDVNLVVNVEGKFDQDKRELVWVFRSLDPVTWQTPEDPTAGFLPPITPSGQEVGWVAFSAKPIDGLGTGAKIRNQAFVEFDWAGDLVNHPAPKEGPWLNTIDAGAPTSRILPFDSAQTRRCSVPVQWAGEDDTGGCGVGGYDVYVSQDGASYTAWLVGTMDISAIYNAEPDHTYSFYSVARDNVGNREQAPASADATIAVLGPCTTAIYRFWSPVTSRHFYTISESERDTLITDYASVWSYEGVAYYAFADSTEHGVKPVYRFWSPVNSCHFYTISEAERDYLIRDWAGVWTFEGVAFYAYPEGSQPAGTLPVYRFWSPLNSCHFYTIDEAEKQFIIDTYPANVWTFEGVAWYAYPQ